MISGNHRVSNSDDKLKDIENRFTVPPVCSAKSSQEAHTILYRGNYVVICYRDSLGITFHVSL